MVTHWPKKRRIIGTRVRRIDGSAKSTGKARYSFDINSPGMLHAVMVRSPHAHAVVLNIDSSAAEKVPGFKALHRVIDPLQATFVKLDSETVTYRVDQEKEPKTLDLSRKPRLYKGRKEIKATDLKAGERFTIAGEVFYAGDEILAVACDTEEHALDAARACKVDYLELPHQVDEKAALKQSLATVPGGKKNTKEVADTSSGKGANAFKDADVVHEGTYGVPVISHQCLESHGLVAEWQGDKLTVWASTQATTGTAGQLKKRLVGSVPDIQVECITHFIGGGFGSKFGPDVQGIVCAELARKTKARVKLMLDRESEVLVGGNRPSTAGTVKIGAKKDGTIVAYEADVHCTPGVGNSGPFVVIPYVYPIPNTHVRQTVVRLNRGSQRAMRAPRHPQSCYMTDCAIDDLAAKLGMDPMQVRLKNLPENDPNAVKSNPVSYNALRGTIYRKQFELIAGLSDWKKKWHPPGADKGVVKHGIGMALHTWGGQASGARNECTVTISRDGSVLARSSTQDLGTGQKTVTAIVVAEVLGLTPKDITIEVGESDYGASSGSGGSTTCPSQAPATLQAATTVREELFKKIAPRLNVQPEDLSVEGGKVVAKGGKSWSWKEACARLGMDQVKATGWWTFPESQKPENRGISGSGVGGVQVAEVEVDTETGQVRCTRVYAVQDCGLIVNKLCCESQVAGGVIMGVNYALFEENLFDQTTGRQVNADMEFYKLGGIRDMPQVIVHMMDMPERGVIGIGEPPTISTNAAVGNAIHNAIGVRVPESPFSPDRVLAALAKK
jgi:xanthine dehydrogenase YagR molybdenum-binding subunit